MYTLHTSFSILYYYNIITYECTRKPADSGEALFAVAPPRPTLMFRCYLNRITPSVPDEGRAVPIGEGTARRTPVNLTPSTAAAPTERDETAESILFPVVRTPYDYTKSRLGKWRA